MVRFLLVALACALFRTHAVHQPRPSHAEWKEAKANEAADKADKAADKSKTAAVSKVLAMLEDLRTQVMDEGEKEAKTYNEFACFCKDTTSDKTAAIQKGTDKKTELSASMDVSSQTRAQCDSDIDGLLKEIEDIEKAVTVAKAGRKSELEQYKKNEADLIGAIEALEGAIKSLKASKQPSLVQVRSTLRTAVLMAEALGLGGSCLARGGSAAQFLLQDGEAPEVPMEDYKFHSGDVIESLEVLLKDFRSEKADVDAQEVHSAAGHDALLQEKADAKKAKNVELEKTKTKKARAQTEMQDMSAEFSTVSAVLLDDQAYLKELADMCSKRAKTWDQRKQVRSDELSALTAAIGIVGDKVASKTSSATIRFAQTGATVRAAMAIARSPGAMEAIEAEAEAAEQPAPSLLQLVRGQAFLAHAGDDGRQAVADLLRSRGDQLKSAMLSSLSERVASDPLGKVKTLIQELVDRLLKEATSEANQKGWCDKALADAKQKRSYAAAEVEELNARMASLEARRDGLAADLAELAAGIAALKASQNETSTLRADEKAENAATVVEAQQGLAAVEEAMEILVKFYKTAAKGASLLEGPSDDAPDAGFDAGESYVGAQGGATGIIGMLDVIKSDFVRTVSETQKSEAQAESDFLAFMTETGKSLAEKETAEAQKQARKGDAEEELTSADEGLSEQISTLETAIKELIELKPACIDTGMSYEERVARREDEKQALTKALCILEAYEKYGPDGAAGAC